MEHSKMNWKCGYIKKVNLLDFTSIKKELAGTKLIEDKHEADEIINTVLNLIESSYANICK